MKTKRYNNNIYNIFIIVYIYRLINNINRRVKEK